jgi:hypothetical protein
MTRRWIIRKTPRGRYSITLGQHTLAHTFDTLRDAKRGAGVLSARWPGDVVVEQPKTKTN